MLSNNSTLSTKVIIFTGQVVQAKWWSGRKTYTVKTGMCTSHKILCEISVKKFSTFCVWPPHTFLMCDQHTEICVSSTPAYCSPYTHFTWLYHNWNFYIFQLNTKYKQISSTKLQLLKCTSQLLIAVYVFFNTLSAFLSTITISRTFNHSWPQLVNSRSNSEFLWMCKYEIYQINNCI